LRSQELLDLGDEIARRALLALVDLVDDLLHVGTRREAGFDPAQVGAAPFVEDPEVEIEVVQLDEPPEQRAHLQARIRSYMKDIRKLTAER